MCQYYSAAWTCSCLVRQGSVWMTPLHDPVPSFAEPFRVCVQHLPFFALSSRFFKNLYSTFYKATMVFDNALTKLLISIQHFTFLPMMLVARFGKRFTTAVTFSRYPVTEPRNSAAGPGTCVVLESGMLPP